LTYKQSEKGGRQTQSGRGKKTQSEATRQSGKGNHTYRRSGKCNQTYRQSGKPGVQIVRKRKADTCYEHKDNEKQVDENTQAQRQATTGRRIGKQRHGNSRGEREALRQRLHNSMAPWPDKATAILGKSQAMSRSIKHL